jgi:hypothetical protein
VWYNTGLDGIPILHRYSYPNYITGEFSLQLSGSGIADVTPEVLELARTLMGKQTPSDPQSNDDGRVCAKCGQFKKWEEYSHHCYGHRGYQSRCKSCNSLDRKKVKYRNLSRMTNRIVPK